MNKPELNDALAKTKFRNHKTFGGKVVEILYGAKDENGNPCVAQDNSTTDGHGRWFGIETDGEYTMFSWLHSKDEGGNVEYGTEFEDRALEVMEEQILTRRELARNAEQIAREYTGADAGEKMEEIKKQWEALKDWNTPVEAELKARFEKALGEFGPRQERASQNLKEKAELLVKAEELKAATNFRDARNALRDLRDHLYDLGSAGADKDREFVQKFNDIDKFLREKQQAYMENRESTFAAAREKKEEIIKKTKNLVANGTNFKKIGDELNSLFDEWKAAGSAGREVDDKYWAEFNELRKEFREKRQAYFNERSKEWAASIEKKKALIAEAVKISEAKVYGRNETERMKALDKEWKNAGYSGKDQNDSLWETFTQAKEVFWNAKKASVFEKIAAGISKKEAELDALKKKVEDLEFRMTIAPNPAMKDDVKKELYLRKSEMEHLEDEIEEEKKRIAE